MGVTLVQTRSSFEFEQGVGAARCKFRQNVPAANLVMMRSADRGRQQQRNAHRLSCCGRKNVAPLSNFGMRGTLNDCPRGMSLRSSRQTRCADSDTRERNGRVPFMIRCSVVEDLLPGSFWGAQPCSCRTTLVATAAACIKLARCSCKT